uniref:RNA-directed DNA polymerase, eukaryota n=1 Tax=Tanacetum cinerariifolium TaxID=118510 RepID=A0A6L2J1U7_TANCI|nr:RNA-directed DNA polymerase, eukaryota [Tanacetum cinerariifolium]
MRLHDNAVVDDDDDKIIAYYEKKKKLTLVSEDYQQTLQFIDNLRVVERHAKAAGEWRWLVGLFVSFINWTPVITSFVCLLKISKRRKNLQFLQATSSLTAVVLGINLLDFMHVKLGNGDKTAFWKDIWIEESREVESSMNNLMSYLVHDITLTPTSDRWIWALESSRDFSVASVRKVIVDKSLSEVDSKTRWIKYVPIKVNVHAWKVKTYSLPTRFNVSRRGIHIDSIMYDIYAKGAETSSHLFFSCCMARQIRMITRWWMSLMVRSTNTKTGLIGL